MINMKIVILGASQGTGLHAVRLALEQNYHVTALSRNIDSLQVLKANVQNADRLEIVKGDVLALETFESMLSGGDAVISCIGVANNKPTQLYSRGILNILNAMSKYQIPRLICVSGLGVEVTPGMSLPLKLATKFIVQPLLRNNFSDMLRMEAVVKDSDVNWTIVRPPRLTNGKLTGKYRVAVKSYIRNPFIIGRCDLAHFIIKTITDPDTYCSTVEVAY
jgi:putative NADH-flavin reductase